jgi:hypothetical protein
MPEMPNHAQAEKRRLLHFLQLRKLALPFITAKKPFSVKKYCIKEK